MANDSPTHVSDSYRDSFQTNLANLVARKGSLEQAIRDVEAEARRALVAALAPLEAQLLDCNAAIYAQERALGALPPVAPARFSERSEVAGDGADVAEEQEETQGGLAANG